MTEVTNAMARLDALLAPQGRELLDRLACEQVTAETALRLGATLRKQYPAELVAAALAQPVSERYAITPATDLGGPRLASLVRLPAHAAVASGTVRVVPGRYRQSWGSRGLGPLD